MEKRKIIIGITGHISSDQRMNRIAGTLTANGFDVTLYYREFFKFRPINLHTDTPFKTVAIKCPFRSGISFYLWYNIQLFFKILFPKTDCFYAVDSDTLPAFILLRLFRRKPLVFDAHEYFSEVPELLQAPLKKRIWDRVTGIGVRYSTICITVGPELATILSARYKKTFTSVRNVPVYSGYHEIKKEGPPVVLYQGALNAGRELELLIDVMKELPEYRCIIAGEGDLSLQLRNMAASCPRIEFAGLLTPADLKKLTLTCFAGYNLLVPESLSYYYSLSNKYFDYMHAGVPSISSRLPEYMELNRVHHCGVCIENTKEALVATLKNLLQDPEYYRNLKENAIIASEKLCWQLEEQVLLNLLASI
jgi:glycosyltransferase involved in cell wall biosynthesis